MLVPAVAFAADVDTEEAELAPQPNPRKPVAFSLQSAACADAFVRGDGEDDVNLAARLDAKMSIDGGTAGLWEGLFINAHFEFVGGAIEAFYGAAITDNFRIGANVQYLDPGVTGFEDAILIGTRARLTLTN